MDIPNHLFYPTVLARKTDDDPLVRSLNSCLRNICEGYLTPGHQDYIDYNERQADWWTLRQGGRRLTLAIEHLAVGGILLDDRYTRAAIDIFGTVVEHRIVENTGGTNYGRPYRTWRDNPLDAGVSSGGLALGLDLLRPVLPTEEVLRFGTYLLPFIDYLLDDPPDPEGKQPENNMACIGMYGLGLLSLVLRSVDILDEDRYARALDLARWRALLFLEKGHDGDGAFYEGPAYGSATLHFLGPLAYALARCGDRDVVEHPGWVRIVEGLAYEMIPATGRLNALNDCNDQINVSWATLVASEQQNGLAQWVWRQVDGPPDDGPVWTPPDHAWSDTVTRYLLYYDASVVPLAPNRAGLPPARHFPNRGLVDIRSGWERDDFFLSFICDVSPAGGHRQADRNHFSLHTLGESFAIDSGYALDRLPDTTEVLRLGALGEAHNLPLIHGEMQRLGPVSTDGIRRVALDAPIPCIQSEAGESHRSADRFTRRLACLPSPDGAPSALIVADYLTFEPMQRPMLSWLLHTHADNRIELGRDRFTLIGGRKGNRCDVQIVTPWPGRWRAETFFDHPRLRYDWFYNPLLCLVVVAPYDRDAAPPEISTGGTADGCGLSIRIGDCLYTALSAAPECTLVFNGIETDAEFALVRTRGDKIDTCLLTAGTRLSAQDRSLVAQSAPVDFTTDRS